MIFPSRFSKRFISIVSFGSILLAFASCGGSGRGDQEGWAPSSAAGYFIRINTTSGATTGTSPGVVQFNFISNSEATIFASTVMSHPFNVRTVANYIKTGKNTFTVSFDYKYSPSAPTSATSAFQANCVVDSQDTDTKYIRGTVTEWSYSGFSFPGGISHTESGSGTNSNVELGVSVPTSL